MRAGSLSKAISRKYNCPKSRILASTRCFSTIQRSTPASYYRGGTSRAIIFHEPDLPSSLDVRSSLFLQAIGAPDPHGRQLNGLGSGISSLSKVCLVGDGSAHGADVAYTFVGIGIEGDEVDYTGNCGNMSSAIGPYAYNKRLLKSPDGNDDDFYSRDGEVVVRIFNTNTAVTIHSTFRVERGQARVDNDTSVDGVSGLGTGVMLDFLRPGGSKTGKLLPTGAATQTMAGYPVSIVDSANPCVFVRAADVGVDATILPDQLSADSDARDMLERIRTEAAVAMGLWKPWSAEPPPRVIPKIAMVAPPVDQRILSGEVMPAEEMDLLVRFISDDQPHRAIPLTGALCTASAAKIPGSVVQQCLAATPASEGLITIGHPSGKVQVNARMDERGDVESASVLRTSRRIMDGAVYWNDVQ